ncbi:hypothetical protein EDC48_106126 [Gibbsiella quercinecans]|nr:hypothetical protein EDC48_106126 [Gibbsiella quercinecans]
MHDLISPVKANSGLGISNYGKCFSQFFTCLLGIFNSGNLCLFAHSFQIIHIGFSFHFSLRSNLFDMARKEILKAGTYNSGCDS